MYLSTFLVKRRFIGIERLTEAQAELAAKRSLTYWQTNQNHKHQLRCKKKVNKGVRGMPRLSEAMKDVISCDKLRGSANNY